MWLELCCLILLSMTITGWRMRDEHGGLRIAVGAALLLIIIVCATPAIRTSFVEGFQDGLNSTLVQLNGEGS